MLRMPVEETTRRSNPAVKRSAALASLPQAGDLALRRAALEAVRRPPMLPNSSRQKGKTLGELSRKDSKLYSAEDIKASLRVSSNTSKAHVRTMQINRYLPVRILSYSIFVCLLLAISFTALQFAGLAEIRYKVAMKEQQLEALQHQRDELTVELAKMSSLSNLEKQATALGLIYPNNTQKVDLPNPVKLSLNTRTK